MEEYTNQSHYISIQNIEKYYFMGILKGISSYSNILNQIVNIFAQIDNIKDNDISIILYLNDIIMIINNLPIYSFHEDSLIINEKYTKYILDVISNELDFITAVSTKDSNEINNKIKEINTEYHCLGDEIIKEKDENILMKIVYENINRVLNDFVNNIIINELKENDKFKLCCNNIDDDSDNKINNLKHPICLINSLLLYNDYVDSIILAVSNVKEYNKCITILEKNQSDEMYIIIIIIIIK